MNSRPYTCKHIGLSFITALESAAGLCDNGSSTCSKLCICCLLSNLKACLLLQIRRLARRAGAAPGAHLRYFEDVLGYWRKVSIGLRLCLAGTRVCPAGSQHLPVTHKACCVHVPAGVPGLGACGPCCAAQCKVCDHSPSQGPVHVRVDHVH